jgi:hypothetical protein
VNFTHNKRRSFKEAKKIQAQNMHNCQRRRPHNPIYILPFYIHPFVSFTLTHIRTHDKDSLTLTHNSAHTTNIHSQSHTSVHTTNIHSHSHTIPHTRQTFTHTHTNPHTRQTHTCSMRRHVSGTMFGLLECLLCRPQSGSCTGGLAHSGCLRRERAEVLQNGCSVHKFIK